MNTLGHGRGTVVLVTGATSGIGLHTATILANQGFLVYGAGRRQSGLDALAERGIRSIALDLTEEQSIKHVVNQINKEAGGVDILINNAGYGSYGAIEDVPLDEARRQFQVNVFGLAELTRLILPHMRSRHRGRILNVSSMAGRMTTYMGAWYHATKYALEAFSDALRMETRRFGIDVVLVEPGCIRTAWGTIAADNLIRSSASGPYQSEAIRVAKGLNTLYTSFLPTSPQKMARIVVRAATVSRPRTRYLDGFGAKALVALHTLLPDRLFDFLMIHAADL